MSWSDLLAWQGEPVPAPVQPLRDLVLGALAEAVLVRRVGAGYCGDCRPAALCEDHAEDLAVACQYEAAFMRVLGIGGDGAMLEILGGLTP